jgi:hypothetical protein
MDVVSGIIAIATQIALAVLAVAAVPLAGFLVAFVRRQLIKVGIEPDAASESRLRQIAADVIAKVEEIARQRIKAGAVPLSSMSKLHMAVADLRTAVPSLTEGGAESLIHSVLPVARAAGVIEPVKG